jgi:two-component system sensor histidine kinase YesM
LREDFNSIYIYVSQDKQISYTVKGGFNALYDPTHESWFQKTVQADGSTVISSPHLPYQFDYNEKVISFSRLLKRLDTNKVDY